VSVGVTLVTEQGLESRHAGITEWYVNNSEGLRQNFTLEQPPAQNSGILRVVLRVNGDLRPELSTDRQTIHLINQKGDTVLHYGGLYVYDAAKKTQPAHFALAEGQIVIEVDDSQAQYPLIIDPLLYTQEAKLTDSNEDKVDAFGSSVALSGDTALVGANQSAHIFVTSGVGNPQPAELPELPATTLSGATSQSKFAGGATNDNSASFKNNFTATDTIEVIGKITIAPNDLEEKEGSIFIVVVLSNSGIDGIYMRDGSQWKLWDGDLAHLTVVEEPRALNATEEVSVVTGLTGLPADFNVFFGYRANNEIHYNAEPIQFLVSP